MKNDHLIDDLHDCKLLSLDVFDTAVVRLVDRPTDIFEIVHQHFEYSTGVRLPWNFRQVRQEAERIARQTSAELGHEDITFQEIYSCLGKHFTHQSLSEGTFEQLRNLELSVEKALIRANPYVLTTFGKAKQLGVPVVFTSDMYLPSEVIKELLERCGYLGAKCIRVSSEYRRTKATGRLFDVLLSEERINAKDVLHIGDNRHSDYAMAIGRGLTAKHLPFENDSTPNANNSASATLNSGIRRYRKLHNPPRADSFWRQFGFEVGGPLLYGFMDWLTQDIRAKKIQKVGFLARDGYILHALCKKFQMHFPDLPDSHYVFASRRALALPAFKSMNKWTIGLLSSDCIGQPWSFALERIGLDINSEPVQTAKKQFELPDQIRSQAERERLEAALRHLVHEIRDRANYERKNYVNYLKSIGITGKERLAIVDIGWHGTMQQYLVNIFRKIGREPNIFGYYLATLQSPITWLDPDLRTKGFLANRGQPQESLKTFDGGVEIFELLLSAPHGTVLAVTNRENGWIPSFDEAPWEIERHNIVRSIHEGVSAFVHDALEVRKSVPYFKISPDEAIAPIHRLISNPSIEEVWRIGQVRHDPWMGNSSNPTPLIPRTRIRFRVLRFFWRRMTGRKLAKGFWPQGERVLDTWMRRNRLRACLGLVGFKQQSAS